MGPPNYRSIQLIKGYLQEVRTYLSYPFRNKQKTINKFVILSMHRSGSSLLVSLLNSHPLIQCEGELLYYRKLFPLQFIEYRNRLSLKIIFGFKLMPNHIGYQGFQDATQFMAHLNNLGYRIIKLTRRNLFHAAISLIFAQESGKFHYKQSERMQGLSKVSIEPGKIIKKIDWFKNLSELQDQITKSLPHLELIYEDHLLLPTQHQATVDRIADFLAIPHAPVYSDIARIGTETIIEYIANIDEISDALRGTNEEQNLTKIN